MSDYGRAQAAADLGPLFDRQAGREARDLGVEQARAANDDFVTVMRAAARRIAKEKGEVHVDDLRLEAIRLGLTPKSSAGWGPIFSERGVWRIVDYRASEFPSNRAHKSPVRVLVKVTDA